MFKASRDFLVLNLDGSHAVDERLYEDQPAKVLSAIATMSLGQGQQYTIPRETNNKPPKRRKKVVRPYCSPDPHGPKYEQYCQQKPMFSSSILPSK